jgi:prepilin-type N-terminal cleavage/methylation domain-containing protein/prepilin-type processing-associated H-X9-DG protein
VRVSSRRGFTLIEMMITISVIAALMAILLPVLGLVRRQARALKCSHHLGQFGHALSLYLDDYRGWLPRRGQGVQPLFRIDRPSDWFNALPPYLDTLSYCDLVAAGQEPKEGDNVVTVCPEALDPGGTYFLSYGMNMYLSPWIRPDPHYVDELTKPSLLVFLADAPGPYSSTVPSKNGYTVLARHRGKANLVFLDGHVVAYEGRYLGCGVGDPRRPDVRWLTETSGINQTPVE